MTSAEEFKAPEGLYYSEGNTYARVDGDIVIVGLTDYGQHLAKKIVYAELPFVGDEVSQGEPIGTIESGKWAGPLNSPVSGEVMEVNSVLEDKPGLLNEDPYGGGWITKIKASKLEEDLRKLMTREEYLEFMRKDIEKSGK